MITFLMYHLGYIYCRNNEQKHIVLSKKLYSLISVRFVQSSLSDAKVLRNQILLLHSPDFLISSIWHVLALSIDILIISKTRTNKAAIRSGKLLDCHSIRSRFVVILADLWQLQPTVRQSSLMRF